MMAKHNFWHLTYDLYLQSQPCQRQSRPPCQKHGHRSNGSAMRVSADGRMDGRYQVHYLPASLSYMVDKYYNLENSLHPREIPVYEAHYIPVRHDMMRQTNDCSPVRLMQHKVKYLPYLT